MLEIRINTEEANRIYLDAMIRIEVDIDEVHALMQSELRPAYELTDGISIHLAQAHDLLHELKRELRYISDDLRKRRAHHA